MNIFEDWQDNWKIRFAVWALPIVGVFYFISLALWFWNPGIFDLKFQFWFFAVVTIGFLITWVLTFFIRKEIWKYGTIGVLVLLTVSVAILAGHFSPGEIRNKAKEIAEKSRMTAESRSVPSPIPPKEEEWTIVCIPSSGPSYTLGARNVVQVGDSLSYDIWSMKGRGKIGWARLSREESAGRFRGESRRTDTGRPGQISLSLNDRGEYQGEATWLDGSEEMKVYVVLKKK